MTELRSKELAQRVRRHCVTMTHAAGSSHVGSSLSVTDILSVLYSGVLRVDAREPEWAERDRFILSKGHAAASLYATLAEVGFFPLDWLKDYYQAGSPLCGHVTSHGVPGVEVSTGSLGHGLSIGAGMALAAKWDEKSYRVFVVLSDGECDEGSTWEAILFAPHHKLDNLVAIVDYNKIQSLDRVENTLALEPFADKWRAFGWDAVEVDGHDHDELRAALSKLPRVVGRPTCIIAHTTKGKGVSFMEDQVLWHYRAPDEAELELALSELSGGPVQARNVR